MGNQTAFEIVGDYITSQKSGYILNLSSDDLTKEKEIEKLPSEVQKSIKKIQQLDAVKYVYKSESMVVVELSCDDNNYYGAYIYTQQDRNSIEKLGDNWYLKSGFYPRENHTEVWSIGDLMELFQDNRTAFEDVESYFSDYNPGNQTNVIFQDLDKKKLDTFPPKVSEGLQSLQKLKIVESVRVSEEGVEFKLGYIDNRYRGSYKRYFSKNQQVSSFSYLLEDRWYLEMMPNV